jgi:hypothetical protein
MSGLLFGERLIEKKKITKKQLQKALERQRLHGGRLGNNMVALGFIDEDDLNDFFKSALEMTARTKLTLVVVDEAIDRLRHDQLVEVKGASQLSKLSYRLSLTEAGIKRASSLLEVSRYVGPAPVTFDDYRNMVEIFL